MHLGNNGVIVLEKQLNTSQSLNAILETKINDNDITFNDLKSKYIQINTKHIQLKGANEQLNEEVHKLKDENMHLIHDKERLNKQL